MTYEETWALCCFGLAALFVMMRAVLASYCITILTIMRKNHL